MKKALIVVDIQNDFCEGGALAVSDGSKVIPHVNGLVEKFTREGDIVVYTADWHPKNHISFKAQGGIWPVHCVQETFGAKLHSSLEVKGDLFQKAFTENKDSYSGFGGESKYGVSLSEYLKKKGVTETVVVGLALDYCVKATALDSVKYGFITSVDLKGTKAVNVSAGDDEKAIAELKSAGVSVK